MRRSSGRSRRSARSLGRVLAVVERRVEVPVPRGALCARDDLPRSVRVGRVAVAALDAAIAHVERLAVDAGIDGVLRADRRGWSAAAGSCSAGRAQIGSFGGRRDLVRQRHRLDDEPRFLLRVDAGHVRLPVVVDLVAPRPEEVELLGVRYAAARPDTATDRSGSVRRTSKLAIGAVRDTRRDCRCRRWRRIPETSGPTSCRGRSTGCSCRLREIAVRVASASSGPGRRPTRNALYLSFARSPAPTVA